METINLRRHYSRNTLLRMIILAVLTAVLVIWKFDLVNSVYFEHQLTKVGLVINGAILVLFALGLLRATGILLVYMREEGALARFVRNVEKRPDVDPLKGVSASSIIARRYATLRRLHEARTPINQNALASTLVASESTRNGLPRFINNILILSGVFGTIVSLSIALLGASNLLQNSDDATSIGLVVHGMSTALSTTITAIVCYLLFGYFFLKLADVQTQLISGVEEISTLHLIPRFETRPESIVSEVADLVYALREVTENMQAAQRDQHKLEEQVHELVEGQAYYLANIAGRLSSMRKLLRDGFRLPDDEAQ